MVPERRVYYCPNCGKETVQMRLCGEIYFICCRCRRRVVE